MNFTDPNDIFNLLVSWMIGINTFIFPIVMLFVAICIYRILRIIKDTRERQEMIYRYLWFRGENQKSFKKGDIVYCLALNRYMTVSLYEPDYNSVIVKDKNEIYHINVENIVLVRSAEE